MDDDPDAVWDEFLDLIGSGYEGCSCVSSIVWAD